MGISREELTKIDTTSKVARLRLRIEKALNGRRINATIPLDEYDGVDVMELARLTIGKMGVYAVDCIHNELLIVKR